MGPLTHPALHIFLLATPIYQFSTCIYHYLLQNEESHLLAMSILSLTLLCIIYMLQGGHRESQRDTTNAPQHGLYTLPRWSQQTLGPAPLQAGSHTHASTMNKIECGKHRVNVINAVSKYAQYDPATTPEPLHEWFDGLAATLGGLYGEFIRMSVNDATYQPPCTTVEDQFTDNTLLDVLLIATAPTSSARKIVHQQQHASAKPGGCKTIQRLIATFDPSYSPDSRSAMTQASFETLKPSDDSPASVHQFLLAFRDLYNDLEAYQKPTTRVLMTRLRTQLSAEVGILLTMVQAQKGEDVDILVALDFIIKDYRKRISITPATSVPAVKTEPLSVFATHVQPTGNRSTHATFPQRRIVDGFSVCYFCAKSNHDFSDCRSFRDAAGSRASNQPRDSHHHEKSQRGRDQHRGSPPAPRQDRSQSPYGESARDRYRSQRTPSRSPDRFRENRSIVATGSRQRSQSPARDRGRTIMSTRVSSTPGTDKKPVLTCWRAQTVSPAIHDALAPALGLGYTTRGIFGSQTADQAFIEDTTALPYVTFHPLTKSMRKNMTAHVVRFASDSLCNAVGCCWDPSYLTQLRMFSALNPSPVSIKGINGSLADPIGVGLLLLEVKTTSGDALLTAQEIYVMDPSQRPNGPPRHHHFRARLPRRWRSKRKMGSRGKPHHPPQQPRNC